MAIEIVDLHTNVIKIIYTLMAIKSWARSETFLRTSFGQTS